MTTIDENTPIDEKLRLVREKYRQIVNDRENDKIDHKKIIGNISLFNSDIYSTKKFNLYSKLTDKDIDKDVERHELLSDIPDAYKYQRKKKSAKPKSKRCSCKKK